MMNPSTTDEALLVRFARGDRDALGELAQRYELLLLGLARGMLGGREDLAMDAVQETWMKVIRYGRSFKQRSSVKTWLYRLTINQCRNVLERRERNSVLSARSRLHMRVDNAKQASPSEATVRSDDARTLHEALEQLDPARRAVVLLCYHAEMTHEQAATILEIPLGTLKSRLHAALARLREALCAELHT
jgi:RNA polymerase sigma-70 factor (ECF subfamily)